MKKPFKETKVGKFLKEKFPDILETAGDLTGIEGLNVISNLIKGKTLSKEDEIEFLKLKNEYEIEIYKLDIEKLRIEAAEINSSQRERGEDSRSNREARLRAMVCRNCWTIYQRLRYMGRTVREDQRQGIIFSSFRIDRRFDSFSYLWVLLRFVFRF
jgi:hypothetical protein